MLLGSEAHHRAGNEGDPQHPPGSAPGSQLLPRVWWGRDVGWRRVGPDRPERMVAELGAGLSSGPYFVAGWTSRWAQKSCLELSALPANSCPGRKAGRHAAGGMGGRGGRQGGCWHPAGPVTFCSVPVILG